MEAKDETKQTEEEQKDESEEEDELEAQEFIFMIDRSGSMYQGDAAIKMAKRALEIFMHSLPDGSRFNICGYGTDFEFLFNESSVLYDE